MNLEHFTDCLSRRCVSRAEFDRLEAEHQQAQINAGAAVAATAFVLADQEALRDDARLAADATFLADAAARMWHERALRAEDERFNAQREADQYASALRFLGVDPLDVLTRGDA